MVANARFHHKNFSKFSDQLRWTNDFSNMKSDKSTTKKPSHSKVDRFHANKGIARIAAKSGSERDSIMFLAIPIIRELSIKITKHTI